MAIKWMRVVLILFFFMSFTFNMMSAELIEVEGIWEGLLPVPGADLRIVFKVFPDNRGILAATMDSPDQGVSGILVDKVTHQGNKIILDLKTIGGVFEGVMSADGFIIEGQWKQSGASFPLLLEKKERITEITRPQEPSKPYPYIEEKVKYENKEAGITLAATLTLPEKKGIFPAALLISGSGPQDRDETVAGHKPFLILADYLTRQGIAVLRADDRGVGESTGDFSQAISKDFASDVLAGMEYLKSREEINVKQIGLIGHSEGGLIAPMVAAQTPDVAFIVLMAGPGLPGEDILYLQSELISRAKGSSEEKIARDLGYNKKLYSLVKEEENQEILKERGSIIFEEYYSDLSEKEKEDIGNWELFVEGQLQSLLSPWFQYFLSYDPRPALRKVQCPVLAMNGEKDLQVPPAENLSAIKKAFLDGGNPHFVIMELKGLNHLFQTAETGSPDEYARIEETISPVALSLIGDWISEQISNQKNN